jgi:type VI secretion system secreted protein Hcp
MVRWVRNGFVLLLGALGLHSSPAMAQATTDGVLCFTEFDGESTRPDSPGCIDVLSWSWGVGVGVDPGGGGNPPQVSAPSFSEITFSKSVDAASEDLVRFLVTGMPVKGIVNYREFRDCGASCPTDEPYLTINFRDVFVTSSSQSGSEGSSAFESISLFYGDISYCYRPVLKDGQGPVQCFAFSRGSNKEIPPF